MSPPTSNLSPPLTTPITPAQLAKHDGSNPSLPIYVAIKGDVFDVSAKKEMYGIGAGYNVFAGKDGSVGLGKSSLKPEDARPDYEGSLEPAERKVLDQWYGFFEKVSERAGNGERSWAWAWAWAWAGVVESMGNGQTGVAGVLGSEVGRGDGRGELAWA